ncbi:MAG: YmdB family metallophosphoesterase [Actinobacteria bacterium]|nr:YmdB family metallophosphoesterase [Actinomycetota bacterium]
MAEPARSLIRALLVGDVVADVGLRALLAALPALRDEHRADLVVVNAENAADGRGTSAKQARQLLAAGADVLTGGNHTLAERSLFPLLESDGRVLRPANLPKRSPGTGLAIVDLVGGHRAAVVNVLGSVFMTAAASPFEIVDALVERARRETPFVFVDVHAEATSEKIALARHLDGRVTAVFGTHTHVQTADARVFPGGTAFVTDLGMTGPHDSVIGVRTDIIVRRFLTGLSERFQSATGDVLIQGAVVEARETGLASAIATFSVAPGVVSR